MVKSKKKTNPIVIKDNYITMLRERVQGPKRKLPTLPMQERIKKMKK